MSDILDKAKEHFKSIDRKIIEVPEWGQTVYSKPLTLADKRKLTRTTKPDDVTLFADVLILKAEDKDGNKLYTLENKQAEFPTSNQRPFEKFKKTRGYDTLSDDYWNL